MRAIVFGSEGTLGKSLVENLKISNYDIVCVDKKDGDLREPETWRSFLDGEVYDELYQMAADSSNSSMLENYSRSMNSSLINMQCLEALHYAKDIGRVFFPSSFYVYLDNSSLYNLEKLYSETLFMYSPFDARIARLFPVYGPGAVIGGRNEKVTTAMCRRVIQATDGDRFYFKRGDLSATRNFLYIDDALRGIRMLMQSDKPSVVDLGGRQSISVSDVLYTAIEISGKDITVIVEDQISDSVYYVTPDLQATQVKIGWFPFYNFMQGMEQLYKDVEERLHELHGERNVQS